MSEAKLNLKPPAHIHFIGICGTAMASLAGILKTMGYKISGSDQNVYPPMSTQLESLNIAIQQGYAARNLEPPPDFVIVGNVISRSNPEAQALLESKIPYTSLPKALGEFVIAKNQSIVVSGTHGKTTTTSMMAWVSEVCGIKAGFLIGGIPENFPNSFRPPQDPWFIIEGDEYDTAFFDKVPKFIHYRPRHVILTSIEFDHADIYKDLNDVKAAFSRLIDLIPADGTLVACADDANVMELIASAKCKSTLTYGLKAGDYRAVERENLHGRNQFCVELKGQKIADVAIKQFGDHNTLNALAVFALSKALGFKEHLVLQGLATFMGVKRRQQLLGEPGGVKVIEDFAHHPTAVRLTLKGLRDLYPNRKVFAVFEPRSATSRRKIFQNDYVQALAVADRIFVAQAYDQSKIDASERFSVDQLIQDLKSEGARADIGRTADDIVELVSGEAKSGDVVVIMSNGGFDGIYQKMLTSLAEKSR